MTEEQAERLRILWMGKLLQDARKDSRFYRITMDNALLRWHQRPWYRRVIDFLLRKKPPVEIETWEVHSQTPNTITFRRYNSLEDSTNV